MQEISFEELRKVHLAEKHSSILSQLSEDYFDVYLKYLRDFYTGLKADFSIEGAKTYENSRKVFLELARLRSHKIALKAFRDTRVNGVSSEGLTTQEKELYLSLLKLFNTYEETLSFKPVSQSAQPTAVKLEVLLDVEAFVSPSGSTIGPFSKGSVFEADSDTAALLVEKQLCKVV